MTIVFIRTATSIRGGLGILAIALAMTISLTAALAQSSTGGAAEDIQRLIDDARNRGAAVVIIQDPAPEEADPRTSAAEVGRSYDDTILLARTNFLTIFRELPEFPGRIAEAIRQHSPGGSAAWPLLTLVFAALYLAIGFGVEHLFHRWARPHFAYLFNPQPKSRAEKISYVLFRGLMQSIGIVTMGAVAAALVYATDDGAPYIRTTALIVIISVALVRLLSVFFQNLFVPYEASHRLLNLTDADALRLHRQVVAVLTAMAVSFALCIWMDEMRLHFKAHTLSLVLAIGLAAILIAVYAVSNRRVIGGMILGGGAEARKPAALRAFARIWHVPVLIYLAAAAVATTVRLVTGAPNALGLVVRPMLLVFAAIAINGILVLIIEWLFTRRKNEAIAAGATGLDENIDTAAPARGLQGLAEHAAGLIVIAGTIWLIARGWGVDITEPGTVLHNIWEIVLIGFLAYIAYEAVKVTVDRKIAEEAGEPGTGEPGDEGGGAGASRLGTLLPLFRNFLVILIFTIAIMIGLSELGVDIAPLFAGAGVIGVAIGFGSQTLIRDIFSGAFFLFDDAFRKGEYIEIGGTRGTVEKISIRSMQLRHHMGPLHTIPFGEITQLTNYSRDWVMMKLPLRLPYDTDVEKVRKLIKNLGNELLQHPEIGEKFMQPLKSQGVYQMEDSAMIIRIKFMTKPGDQFTVRKIVYARIRELFEEHGIRFANREVTVRVAETPGGKPLTPKQKEAVTGAVRPILDEEDTAPAGAGDGR